MVNFPLITFDSEFTLSVDVEGKETKRTRNDSVISSNIVAQNAKLYRKGILCHRVLYAKHPTKQHHVTPCQDTTPLGFSVRKYITSQINQVISRLLKQELMELERAFVNRPSFTRTGQIRAPMRLLVWRFDFAHLLPQAVVSRAYIIHDSSVPPLAGVLCCCINSTKKRLRPLMVESSMCVWIGGRSPQALVDIYLTSPRVHLLCVLFSSHSFLKPAPVKALTCLPVILLWLGHLLRRR